MLKQCSLLLAEEKIWLFALEKHKPRLITGYSWEQWQEPQAFWQELKQELDFLPGDTLDCCFLSVEKERVLEFLLELDKVVATQWSLKDVESLLGLYKPEEYFVIWAQSQKLAEVAPCVASQNPLQKELQKSVYVQVAKGALKLKPVVQKAAEEHIPLREFFNEQTQGYQENNN